MPPLAENGSDDEDDPVECKIRASERTKLYASVPEEIYSIDGYCYDSSGNLIEERKD